MNDDSKREQTEALRAAEDRTEAAEQRLSAIEAARLDGFQQGLRTRDEQIRTGTLPEGIRAPEEVGRDGLSLTERRAEFAYEGARLQAIAVVL